MTGREVPRSVRELILRDLARQTRTLKGIAERHHVHVDTVTALRDHFGPGPVELLAAAEEAARPLKPAPEPGELDPAARKSCRAWALVTGRTTAGVGPLSRSIVEAWEAAGRPEAPQSEPTPEPAEETPDDEPDDEPEAAEEAPEAAPYCATCDDTEVVVQDGKVTACACSPEDEVVDAEILPPWHDWPALLDRADRVPAVAFELRAVISAVEMLRDALREHDHREQLVMRVQDAIKPQGLHLTADQVRLVLDAIEAA